MLSVYSLDLYLCRLFFGIMMCEGDEGSFLVDVGPIDPLNEMFLKSEISLILSI